MEIKQCKSIFLVVFIMLLFVLPYKSDAYVDPNTGGFFFTTVLPFVYGILAAVVIFWKRIANSIKGFFSKKKEERS